MLKHLLTILLVITFVSSGAAFATVQAEPFDSAHAYRWALDSGFSEGFLQGIDDATLQHVYNSAADSDIFTIEETMAGNSKNAISSDMMTYRITLVKFFRGDTMDKINVYVTATWQDGHPHLRFTDLLSVTWNDTNWICGDSETLHGDPFLGVLSSSSDDGKTIEIHDTASNPAQANQESLAWFAHLEKLGFGDESPAVRIAFTLIPKNTTLSAEELMEGFFIESTYSHYFFRWVTDAVSAGL